MTMLPTSPSFPSARSARRLDPVRRRSTGWLAVGVTVGLLLVGCTQPVAEPPPGGEAPGSTAQQAGAYPLTISNCGVEITLDQAPQRVVATSLPGLETAVAMGIADKIVGTAGVVDSLLPEYREQAADIPLISKGGFPPPSKEAVLGVDPDFVVSGYIEDFGAQTLGDRAQLAAGGLPSYLSEGSCDGATVADAESDLINYGRIFGVPDRAQELVAAMREQIAAAPKATDAPKVIILQGDPAKPLIKAESELGDNMITAIGGMSVPTGVETMAEISWEKIIQADPDVIIVASTAAAPGDETINWIKRYAPAKSVSAVREGRFLSVPVTDLIPGVRTGQAYATMAEALAAS